jgi:hypothetical protein
MSLSSYPGAGLRDVIQPTEMVQDVLLPTALVCGCRISTGLLVTSGDHNRDFSAVVLSLYAVISTFCL